MNTTSNNERGDTPFKSKYQLLQSLINSPEKKSENKLSADNKVTTETKNVGAFI